MLLRTLTLASVMIIPGLLHAQDTGYRIIGAPDAPVEMTVYFDFECPYCRNFALAALPAIIAEFVNTGQLRLRFVYFPLAAIHRNAVAAAKAAHCAGLAGRFWSFHDYVFVRQPEWAGQMLPDDLWVRYAANLGLDPVEFSTCLASSETHAVVEQDLREALAAGATGTPTVVLGGEVVTGLSSYDALRQEIVNAVERAAGERAQEPS